MDTNRSLCLPVDATRRSYYHYGLGNGSTLGYMREGVSAREIFELQKLSGLYGLSIDMHFRSTPGDDVGEVNGIQEMLANAATLGTPAIAAHFNNAGYNLVHELLVRMREKGDNVNNYKNYKACPPVYLSSERLLSLIKSVF